MMNKILLLFIIFCMISCSSKYRETERQNPNLFYRQFGLQKYFLAFENKLYQFDDHHHCFFNNHVSYVNLQKISDSYNLSYSQSILFQLAYNIELRKILLQNIEQKIFPSRKEKIFFKLIDQVKVKNINFDITNYKRVHFLEVDALLDKPKSLKHILDSSQFSKGSPVFISYCNSRAKIKKFIKDNNLEPYLIQIITQDMFSIYNDKFNLEPIKSLSLSGLFTDKHLVLFLPEKSKLPLKLKGKFDIRYYKNL